jgi:hypothetical protein
MTRKMEKMIGTELFRAPTLTPSRIRFAYGAAVVADGLQMILGPLGWLAADQAIDVITGVVMWRLLGFHPLLLPTFVVEFLPIIDMLPTWTGCVALVISRRKKQQAMSPHEAQGGKVIDVDAKRVE